MTLDQFIEAECAKNQSAWLHKDDIKLLIEKWEIIKKEESSKNK